MIYMRKANERGVANFGWLNSKHSFSFGNYYDSEHMGVSVLRVINDDTVDAGAGFDTHGHKDMEIVSYVTKGALKHKDSEGNEALIPAGDIQRMSAGTGIMHSEYNASDTQEVKFLQIWVLPQQNGIKPSYEQKKIVQDGPLTAIVTPNGSNSAISISQDMAMYRLVLKKGERFSLATEDRIGYLHLVDGNLAADNEHYSAGDAFALGPQQKSAILASENIEAIWFDLPTNPKP